MGNQTPEQRLDKEIKIWCGQHNMLCFHANVGKIKFYDPIIGKERVFDTGFPKGTPDLFILDNKGHIQFCETKIHPRKPTQEQLHFIEMLQKRGFNAFVAYNLEEFIKNIKIF